jgi:hypothetical protein
MDLLCEIVSQFLELGNSLVAFLRNRAFPSHCRSLCVGEIDAYCAKVLIATSEVFDCFLTHRKAAFCGIQLVVQRQRPSCQLFSRSISHNVVIYEGLRAYVTVAYASFGNPGLRRASDSVHLCAWP